MDFDASFEVRFVHRLRFTHGVFDPANATLTGVLEPAAPAARMVAFIDSNVGQRHHGLAERIEAYARAHGQRLAMCGAPQVVPGGEVVKNDRTQFEAILQRIHDAGLCRHSYVLVIGGGAVLDAVGFAAAVAHRGVRLIRLPTTTLSQADSGAGVKNSINAFGKKNYVGTFTPPWAVINDEAFLETLSDRDWLCGFSEAVKVAVLKDPALFDHIVRATPRIRGRDLAAAWPVLQRSAELHLQHITAGGDPFELTAARPLDFGHWAAHKLEQLTDYELRHGEAVAIGIAIDVAYAALMGYLDAQEARTIHRSLLDLGFVLDHPALQDPTLFGGLDEFREHLGGELTITLPQRIGASFEVHEVHHDQIRAAIRQLASLAVHTAAEPVR